MDITDSLAPNSDQLDAIDLVGGARVFTVAEVSKGNAEQPVQVHLAEFPRVWRPGKSMRRVLAAGWGTDASKWTGRRVELFCDPDVVFGGAAVGGTRISRMSHIDKALKVPLLIKRGKSAVFTVQPLPDAPTPQADPIAEAKTRLWNAWTSLNEPDAAALTAAFNEATGADLSTATPEQMHEYADTLTTADTTEETP